MSISAFLSAAVLLTLMPGPDILFVITQSVTRGRRAGIVFAAGLCSGLIVHTLAVCLGVAVLISRSETAFALLKTAGALYLLYLGVKSFRNWRRDTLAMPETAVAAGKLYRKGILMNLLNPKVVIFFLAFFPQFIRPGSEPIGQMLLLGLIFMVQAFLIFSLVAVLAGLLRRKLSGNPRISRVLNLVEASIYCIIAAGVVMV